MIEDIFSGLKQMGAVRSTDEFSTEWLGREKSYMRCMRARRRHPSSTVLATCAVRLLRTADGLSISRLPPAQENGLKLRSLANKCLEEILTQGARR